MNKVHHKYQSEFVGYLYILDLINTWKMEHIKVHLQLTILLIFVAVSM